MLTLTLFGGLFEVIESALVGDLVQLSLAKDIDYSAQPSKKIGCFVPNKKIGCSAETINI